ncbi:MAG: hypothetical protein K2P94_16310 [Rhodospirillaceae bacterium]|nr:hypothetical protein [Rhodospirillaceae bacterium]
MRKISIIGAGQAGLILALALLQKGYTPTLYSDRTADQWLNESRPTGTAYLFAETIDIERALGIDYWSATMFTGEGLHTHVAQPGGGPPMTIAARTPRPGAAVDQRLKFHAWMNTFEARGGKLVIEAVTPTRADEIAAASDLTVLAAGKADLGKLVPRDVARSVYDKPVRRLAMAIVRNTRDWSEEVGFRAVKFSSLGPPFGDVFFVPYTHKTAGATWCPLVEALPGGPLDIFADAASGHDVVERLRTFARDHMPWDYDIIKDMEYVAEDPLAWLTGAFPPTVREAYGTLPSGALLMPIGDTAITFDPVGGQGGNSASWNARFVADAIIARDRHPFDAAWMSGVRDGYWNARGKHAYAFNNMFLEPPTPAFMELMKAAAGSRRTADRLFGANVPMPQNFFPWITDLGQTLARIRAAEDTA